jgi:hypothetical protein
MDDVFPVITSRNVLTLCCAGVVAAFSVFLKSRWRDLNPRPLDYELRNDPLCIGVSAFSSEIYPKFTPIDKSLGVFGELWVRLGIPV